MKNGGLIRGTRHSSGLMSTRIISGPIRLMQCQGIRKSSRRPNTLKKRQGPGTTMEQIFPSGISIFASHTKPSLRPSQTQMTSLHFKSLKLIDIPSAPFPVCFQSMTGGKEL